ncbi:hypothetical protein GWK47_027854 [Chionoecetes opilio]|uniref:Uncharacterized protein n=1 Tax=Chionoecetes opilio TaxID=41210 RepID=A0A8J8WB63_CHIOP|nr:hypothetical protein GWK47_027854 [Chionoecetes opilio]
MDVKSLYSFKIWMFLWGQFPLDEEGGAWTPAVVPLRRPVYAKAWIEASFSVQNPRLDLELIKALGTYDKIDPEIGDVALSKLSSHLWYVSENWLGCPSSTPTCPCETKKSHGYGPTDERNLNGEDRLRKSHAFQRSRSKISTWKTSSVDVLSILPEATPG